VINSAIVARHDGAAYKPRIFEYGVFYLFIFSGKMTVYFIHITESPSPSPSIPLRKSLKKKTNRTSSSTKIM